MRKSQFYFLVAFLVLLAFFITSRVILRSSAPQQKSDQRPTVYTSIYPVYDFTSRIAGTNVKVINVLPAGSEPHSFQPTARLVAQIGNSHLFLYNGLGMEPYLEKLKTILQTYPVLLANTSSGVLPLGTTEDHHGLSAMDPHIWLSPSNAAIQGYNILQALLQIDPAHEKEYQANYRVFQAELRKLDQEYKAVLKKCSKSTFLVSHAAFGYLARDYNLKQVSVVGLNAEAEPTPGIMSELIELAQKEQISYIFYETFSSPKVSQVIAREIMSGILTLHSLGNLTAREANEGADYFSIMRENLANLQIGLGYRDE